MSTQSVEKFSGYTTNGNLKCRRALIVTPSSTKAMDVSGGVAKVNLKRHIRTVHEKQKDFCCEECGHAFSKKLALKAHLAKVHSIGTTYDCQECGKKFGKKTTLNLHVETVHRGIKHQCHSCVKSFTQIANLKKHILKNHP